RLIVDFTGEVHSLLIRHNRQLRSGTEWAVGLRPVQPHTLTNSTGVHAVAHGVDYAGTIAVRNDARELHPVSEPVAAFLGVARVHARESKPDADLAVTWLRVGHLADLEHLRRRSRPLVPSCEHERTLDLARAEHGSQPNAQS